MDQVLRAADLGQRAVLIEQVLQRDRVGDLAALHQLADRLIDAAVQRDRRNAPARRNSLTRS